MKGENSGTPLRVRVASASDIPSLHDFLLEAWREAGPSAWGWTGATEASIQELASADFLHKLLSNPRMKILLATGDDRIVGFAANRKVDETTVELAGIIVSEHSTGKGVGTALMKACLETASTGGFDEVIVKTETFNARAIGFYEANGFERTGESVEEIEGKRIDLVVLRRRLGVGWTPND